jgi:hypothetical protein
MSPALLARRGLALVVFAAALVLSVHLIGDLNRVKALKTELGEINNVRYGLLDADQWVMRLSAVLERRINEFELTEANRPQIKQAVAQVLDSLLVQVEQTLRRRNLQGSGNWADQVRGILQQGLQDLLIDFDDLRRKVPAYAELVVQELSKPEAKREIKAQLLALMQQAAGSTFAKTDRTRLEALLAARGCPDVAACDLEIGARIEALRSPVLYQLLGLLALVVLLFGLCLSPRGTPDLQGASSGRPGAGVPGLDPFRLLLLTGATLILLAGGLLTPMIEIDARISNLSIQLLGEPVVFTNQVLYFQTKSIFDVVSILMREGGADMLLVGVLLVLFSVIFPLLKLIATYLYYYDYRGLRRSGPVRFFALKSGKWSMADVLVIAIFMAYIGFSGLAASQLGSLRRAAAAVEVLTTNGTSLAPGFYLFLAFVLASLFLSSIIENRVGEGHST